MSNAAKIATLTLWIVLCSVLSVWAWVQVIQWIAQDMRCP